jgi:DNA-binding winged helix-turn-helix (wHTH) protein
MEQVQPLRLCFGPFRIDEAEALLRRDGETVDVPPRAFQVLCELARHPGQLVTKDALLDAVWGHRHINESALKNVVNQLRQALGDDARESRYVQTAPRRGYRFIAPVAAEAAAPAIAPGTAYHDAHGSAPGSLVGRGAALAQLHDSLAAARTLRRQLVFVLGEAGAGKSALIDRFTAACGARVAFGQCIEHYGSGEAYMPVLEALNALCRADGGEAVIRTMREVAPTWLLQLPWFVGEGDRGKLQHEAGGVAQDRMLREFGELIDRVADDKPVLLVLEDLHWCDHATVQLLGYLAHRRARAALMVLGSLRPTELILEDHPLAALRQQLRTRRLSLEVDLEFLSEADISAYLAERFGDAPPESFVHSLHAHTAGLPLFVVNVVDELVSAGTLRREAGVWHVPEPGALTVPRNVLGLIDAQIGRLPAEYRRVLGAASLCGVEFLHVPLAEVLGMPADTLQALLDDGTRRVAWLRLSGAKPLADGRIASRYAFGHTMYRQVLLDGVAPAQKLQWHRQWAAALAAAYGPAAADMAAELSLHYERGQLPAAAAQQLAIVCARALDRGAAHEALAAARRALVLGDGRLATALELELRVMEGVALTRLHVVADPQVAAAFGRALALRAEREPAWTRALQGAWWVHFARGEFAQARELAEQMERLAATGDEGLRLAARTAGGFVKMLWGDTTGGRAEFEAAQELHAREGLRLAPSQFVQDPGVEVASGLALACWLGGEPQRARELARHAAVRAASNGHALSETTALSAQAILHALAREFDAVYEITERLYAVIRDHGLPAGRSDFAWLHGRALVARGQVEEGLREMRNAAESADELGMRFGLCGYHHHHVQACLEAGQVTQARESAEAGIALATRLGGHMVLPGLLAQRAELLAMAGEDKAATQALRAAIDMARTKGSAFFELVALAAAQHQRNAAGDPARLRELLALYAGDPSPRIAEIRALASAAS